MSNQDDKELLSSIFEVVQQKKAEKPTKKKRVMTPEQRAKAIENLKKGRETSMRNRKAKAEAKKATKEAPAPAPAPAQAPTPAPSPAPAPEPELKARHKGVVGLDGDASPPPPRKVEPPKPEPPKPEPPKPEPPKPKPPNFFNRIGAH